MQVAVDGTPIATILENTINISGIVVETNFNYGNTAACQVNGPTPKCQSPIVYFASKESYGHVAILRDFRIDSEEKNAMYNAVDSSWIIYPEELNLQVGDSLYIKNYSAVYSYLFNEKFHCDLPPKMYATGEYFVNPTEDILATPRSRVLKVEKPKIHNHDAGGRCVNDKKRNVIRY